MRSPTVSVSGDTDGGDLDPLGPITYSSPSLVWGRHSRHTFPLLPSDTLLPSPLVSHQLGTLHSCPPPIFTLTSSVDLVFPGSSESPRRPEIDLPVHLGDFQKTVSYICSEREPSHWIHTLTLSVFVLFSFCVHGSSVTSRIKTTSPPRRTSPLLFRSSDPSRVWSSGGHL